MTTPRLTAPATRNLHPSSFIPHPSLRRSRRSRRGVILLLVVSLLALFILLGATFSVVAIQALHGSKLELKVQQHGDLPETEMDLVMGQILYDTQARTALQYHSLLRDLYGYDAGNVITPAAATPAPQFRESIQGNVISTQSLPANLPPFSSWNSTALAGGQFYQFPFALQPFSFNEPPLPLPAVVQGQTGLPAAQTLTALSDIPHYYAGRVITFTTGAAANHSARIVGYQPFTNFSAHRTPGVQLNNGTTPPFVPPYGLLTIEMIESKHRGQIIPSPSDSFIINGAPFNGAGAGFDIITGNMDQVVLNQNTGLPTVPPNVHEYVALLPNYAAYDGRNAVTVFDHNTAVDTAAGSTSPHATANKIRNAAGIGFGGFDESWDAPDLQNMYLAMVPPRVAVSWADTDSTNNLPVLPSYHRPELITYWFNWVVTNIFTDFTLQHNINDPAQQAEIFCNPYGPVANSAGTPAPLTPQERDRIYNIRNGCFFRPMPWDHPNFSGSNPNLATTAASSLLSMMTGVTGAGAVINPWDIDNDNDGVPDSIWVDPGLPIITLPDGRRVKRLAAILIKDLDGLININAHGNLQEARVPAYRADSTITGGIASGVTVPRGLGYGPAEVSFYNMFTAAPNDYARLLTGRYTSNRTYTIGALIGGTTVYDNFLTDAGATLYKNTNLPFAAPGLPYRREPLAAVKHNGIPANYTAVVNHPNYYASPPDVWGRGAIVLDYGGQPFFAYMGQPLNPTPGTYNSGDAVDTPYELALNGSENGTDSPYTVAELELLYRYHDPDAPQLGRRIIDLAPSFRAAVGPGQIDDSQTLRNMVSVVSSDLPVTATTLPPELRGYVRSSSAQDGRIPGSTSILDLYRTKLANGGLSGANLEAALKQIAPWEFFKGQKFDVNRPFGDGVDNNGNNAPDDNLEYLADYGAGGPPTPPAPAATTLPNREFAWGAVDTDGDDAQSELPAIFYNHEPRYINSVVQSSNRNLNQYARQLYARHLFCLALLLIPDDAARGLYNPNFSTLDPNLPAGGTNLHQSATGRWMIRRLAQWAINCAEFRDADSIMTPFEFDYNPWDGWTVDGNIGDATDRDATDASGRPIGGLVWGMEAPDLLITETLALHDRRCKDTDRASSNSSGNDPDTLRGDPMNADPDLDQYRIPQGSLFVELYCPRSRLWSSQNQTNKPRGAGELANGVRQVMLGRTDPVGDTPIWRLAMTKLDRDPNGDLNKFRDKVLQNPQTIFSDPANFRYMPQPGTVLDSDIDRLAYFTPLTNVPLADQGRSFYVSTPSATTINPGGYAIIAPRLVTYFGSKDRSNPNITPLPVSAWGGNSNQRIDLTNYQIRNTSNVLTSRVPFNDMQPPTAIVCDMLGVTPSGWTAPAPWGIGLNVTEPLPTGTYYPEPLYSPSNAPATVPPTPRDFYDDPDAPLRTFLPQPLEGPTDSRPISEQQMISTGTYESCSNVLLQRLADPTRPFDAEINPYLTVDWSPVDVTVFNGEEDNQREVGAMSEPIDPLDTNLNGGGGDPNTRLSLFSRQRGYLQATAPTGTPQNIDRKSLLWAAPIFRTSTYPTPLNGPSASNATGAYFSVDLSSTSVSPNQFDAQTHRHSLFSINSTLDSPISGGEFAGEPSTNLFPWFNWSNRPYSNALELFSVPASSPSRTYLEMIPGFPNIAAPAALTSPYYDAVQANDDLLAHAPFGHIFNFFEAAQLNPATPAEVGKSPHLYRIFDFLEVPSPFIGTERWYNPVNFAVQSPPLPPDNYWAPFNKLSRFRDPGRINVNTIFDAAIWDAAVAQFPDLAGNTFFEQLGRSRRGTASGTNWYEADPSLPSRFANPFRTADSADLMPPPMRVNRSVDATLLRPAPGSQNNPLFQMRWTDPANPATHRHHDTERNPYFRYQGYQKLGNILTTRSNCFAIWITIGYFEVEENRPTGGPLVFDAAHPDGYRLGQEIGIDSGEVVRHRSFFVVDRSIPVGFMPGSRLNTDDCILVRRLIE